MENTTSQTKAEAVREVEVGAKKENLEFLVSLPEENISKILSASASITIDKYEALLGELSFSGQACLNFVYSLEDGTISNYKTCQDFSGKFENLSFDPSSLVKVLPNVLDISIESANGSAIKVKLTVENTFSLLKNQEILLFSSEDPNIYVKQSEIGLCTHANRNCSNFNQTSVFETKFSVGRILSTSSVAIVNKTSALDGIVVVEGDTISRILYSTGEERPVLVSQVNKDSFREEIEDSMATKDSPVLAWATVDGRDIEENIDQENKTIEVNVPVRICYDLFSCQERTVVSDAFSTENKLNLTTEAFLSTEVVGMETFDSRIDSSITASEDIPRIDKILAVDGAYLTRTSLTFNDGELSSEGTVHLNIIYLNDEEDSINAVSVEVPYSYNEKLSIQGSNVVATDQIIEIDASVKRGRDIYVDGKIRTQVLVTNEVQTAAISGAELGEKLEERDGALEIYFAQEGKSFWDVAKDLKVSEDALRQQNPEIVEPFEKDEKIVYFEQFEISVD